MNDLKPAEHTAARDAYQRVVRRYWRTFLFGNLFVFVLFGVTVAALSFFYPRGHPTGAIVVVPLLLLAMAVNFVAQVAVWGLMISWSCPRCHNLFNWTWIGGTAWPTGICKHCSLDLRTHIPPNNRKSKERKDD